MTAIIRTDSFAYFLRDKMKTDLYENFKELSEEVVVDLCVYIQDVSDEFYPERRRFDYLIDKVESLEHIIQTQEKQLEQFDEEKLKGNLKLGEALSNAKKIVRQLS